MPAMRRRVADLAGAALLPACSLLAVRPLADPDVWWHLANGRAMVTAGTLSPVDERAFTVAPAVRVNPSWLWDLLCWALERAVGLSAVLVLPCLFLALAMIAGSRLAPPSSQPWVRLAGLLAMPALLARALPRPDVAGLLAVAVLVLALHGRQDGRGAGRAALVAGLTALWVHVHASFLLAPLFLFPALLEAAWGRRHPSPERPRLGAVLSGIGGLGLGLLTHPAGPGALLGTVAGQLDRSSGARILEWLPPDPTVPSTAFALALLPVSYLALRRMSGPRPWSLVVPAVACVLAAVSAVRMVAPAALVVWLLVARCLREAPPPAPRFAVPGLLVALLLLRLRSPLGIPGLAIPVLEAPPGALQALAEAPARPDGSKLRLLSWFDLGGIVSWRLGERWQVAMDARAELGYPKDVQVAVTEAFSGGERWVAFDRAWSPDGVLLPKDAPLCRELHTTAGWSAAAFDAHWVVFLRDRAGQPRPGRRFAALDPCGSETDQLRACRADPQRAGVEAAAALAEWDVGPAPARLAGMLALGCGGDPASAERWLEEAVRRDPRDTSSRLARLLARRAVGAPDRVDWLWLAWFDPDRLPG